MTTTSTHAQNLLLPSVQDNPVITMTNHANSKLQLIVEYLLLPHDFERPAIMTTVNTRNLLPFFVQNNPAITIASSLQLIVESLFLLCNKDNSETMAPSLLLFCIKDAPAIMMAPLTNFSLQLIFDIFCKISFHFCEVYRRFCEGEYQYQDDNGHQELSELISNLVGFVGLANIGGINIVGQHTGINLVGHHTGIGPVGCTSPNSFNGVSGIIGQIGLSLINSLSLTSLVGLIGFIGLSNTGIIGFIGHTSLNGHNGLVGIFSLIRQVSQVGLNSRVGLNGLISHISISGHNGLFGFGLVEHTKLIGVIGLNSFNSLDGIIGLVSFGLNNLDGFDSIIGLVGFGLNGCIGFIVGIVSLIVLAKLNNLVSLIGGRVGYGLGLVSLISLIGRIGLNGHNDVDGLINKMEFEISCYSLVRESWLWCVRRVLSSLARLDSDFFFGHALQHAKQVFLDRIPQVTKYFVMRECEDSYMKSRCCDSAFPHKKEFYIFKFPERFLEISCAEISLFS
jgi:hypothetical protein